MTESPAPNDPSVHLVIQKKIVADDLAIVCIRVRHQHAVEQEVRASLSRYGITAIEHNTATHVAFSFYLPKGQRLVVDQLLGAGAKTLVDSHCDYGEFYSWHCHGRTVMEKCVDDGASGNRCSDRCDSECAMMYWSWTPPTCS